MRGWKALAVLTAVLALSGCLPPAATTPSGPIADPPFQQLAEDALGDLPGVVAVEVVQVQLDSMATPDPMLSAEFDITVSVTVSATATVDDVVAIAEATSDFSEQNATTGPWVAAVGIEVTDQIADDDMPGQSAVGFEVYPDVRVSAGDDAREVMQLLAEPGVESVSFADVVPFVQVTAATDLQATLDYLADLPLWAEGGKIWAESGRVRLTLLPDTVTARGTSAIIAASVAVPAAQFWLEAATTGPSWPQLFIDQATTDDAATATALLTDASASPAAVNDYDVEFFIRVIGPDGPIDTAGVIGKS